MFIRRVYILILFGFFMDRIPIYTPVAGLEALAGSAVYLNIPHGMQVNR